MASTTTLSAKERPPPVSDACVVATSAWIEWPIGGDAGRELALRWPGRDDRIVPTIVQLELSTWAMRGRLPRGRAPFAGRTVRGRAGAMRRPVPGHRYFCFAAFRSAASLMTTSATFFGHGL